MPEPLRLVSADVYEPLTEDGLTRCEGILDDDTQCPNVAFKLASTGFELSSLCEDHLEIRDAWLRQ